MNFFISVLNKDIKSHCHGSNKEFDSHFRAELKTKIDIWWINYYYVMLKEI